MKTILSGLIILICMSACKQDKIDHPLSQSPYKNITGTKPKETTQTDVRDQYCGLFEGEYRSGVRHGFEDFTHAIVEVTDPEISYRTRVVAMVSKKTGSNTILLIELSKKKDNNNEAYLEPFITYEREIPQPLTPAVQKNQLSFYVTTIQKDLIYLEKNLSAGSNGSRFARHESVTLTRNTPY